MSSSFWSSPAAMIAVISVAAALLGLAVYLVARPRRVTVGQRIARFVNADSRTGGPAASDASEGGLFGAIDRALEKYERWGRYKEELEIAEISTPASHILVATVVGTAFGVFLAGSVLNSAMLAPLGFLVPVGVRWAVNRRLRKRRRQFADQLADNLQALASAMRAGQSMTGAMSVVVEEAPEPTRTEFRRIISDERAGVPLEEAIRDVGRRMDNRDMEQLALVAIIQRETGGNTAEVLDRVIEMIRERSSLRRLMETLTAQGRLSQIVISVIPVALLVAIATLNRGYLEPLLDDGSGRIWLAAAAILSIVGSVLVKRIVEIKV